MTTTIPSSTSNLKPGDITPLGTVARVERRADNLNAFAVYFSDESHFHASTWDIWHVTR